MDLRKYFAVTHRDHLICNPLSAAKVDEMVDLLRLPRGARVLDIACGKAEALVRIAERYDVTGVGIELSPDFARDARAKVAERLPGRQIEIVEGDGAQYTGEPGSFDLAMCLGASWIFEGHRGTLRALARFARPGALVATGEPFWHRPPPREYVAAGGEEAAMFGTHAGNVTAGIEEGLTPLCTFVSNQDDWDRYQGLQWQAAERWAFEHAADPDAPELIERHRRARDLYLWWERDLLGWAIYLFRR